jgi:hypothetical protein
MEGNGRDVLVDFAVAFVNLLHAWFPGPRDDLYTCSGRGVKLVLSRGYSWSTSQRDEGKGRWNDSHARIPGTGPHNRYSS